MVLIFQFCNLYAYNTYSTTLYRILSNIQNRISANLKIYIQILRIFNKKLLLSTIEPKVNNCLARH